MDYEHGKVYVFDAASQTFDRAISTLARGDKIEHARGSKTAALGVPEIVVTSADVRVCGVRVERPESIGPSQWLRFWTEVVAVK